MHLLGRNAPMLHFYAIQWYIPLTRHTYKTLLSCVKAYSNCTIYLFPVRQRKLEGFHSIICEKKPHNFSSLAKVKEFLYQIRSCIVILRRMILPLELFHLANRESLATKKILPRNL